MGIDEDRKRVPRPPASIRSWVAAGTYPDELENQLAISSTFIRKSFAWSSGMPEDGPVTSGIPQRCGAKMS
jgi:hypothetical protein